MTAGAALGWVFAIAATRALADWSGIESGLDPDRNVLLFTLGTSVLSALTFGLAPLWVALRSPVAGVLRATTANVTRSRCSAARGRLLMSCQVAICLLLLVAAGLLLRTLRNYATQDLGLRADGLLVFGVTPQTARTPQETFEFYCTLIVRIRNLPGIEGVTFMDNRIGSGWSNNNDDSLDGVNLVAKFGDSALIRSNAVGPDYFHVLGIPILQGRDISDADTPTSTKVAVVNETFAKRFLPNTNPLGHRLGDNRTIVGVVKDSKYSSVDEPTMPMAYYAIQYLSAGGTTNVEVRAHGEPLSLLPAIRHAVAEIDPGVPLESPITQQAQFELSYSEPKMFARLGGFFGLLSSLLVATGLFGTSSYRTRRRTTEIGMRMAFGAQRGQVLWMVLRESLLICAIGIAIGLPAALLGVRLVGSMLYQLSPFDPVSFTLAMGCVALVGGAAALLPAWRAAEVDPMVALRYE